MKAIAWEIQEQKEITDANDCHKSKKEKKEPTPEHLLLRESADAARTWENAIYAKHTEGQGGEIVDRAMEYMGKSEFPTEPFHNWTEGLMEEAKTGWYKFKAFGELLNKYPLQNMEQTYRDDTDEWVWV